MNPFACAIPIGTTKFLWLIAGPQREAENDRKFQQHLAEKSNEVTQLKEEK